MSNSKENDDSELQSKIDEYLEFAGDLETGSELKELAKETDQSELKKLMMKRLQFGEDGIRAKMGPGYGAINELVIIQTAQGIVEYLSTVIKEGDKSKGVVIGFDNRYNSERFANLIAVSFLLKEFKVFLFSVMVPTPFVSYTVVRLKSHLGIMVTASQKPSDFNGLKVFRSNGAPLSTEYADGIEKSILENLEPWENSKDTLLVWTSPLAIDPWADIVKMYFEEIKFNLFLGGPPQDWKSLNIALTSLHGVSYAYLKRGFQILTFGNFFPEKDQMRPDPEFPTVEVPSLDEDKNLMDVISTADENECQLILALDPDADGFRMAESKDGGRYHIFTGNEIAALLGSFLWEVDPSHKKNPANFCMVSSVVSSKILRTMAAEEGFKFFDTLTGFKWISNMAEDCIKKGMRFLFAFEESLGFMCGPMVMYKDGILTAMQMLLMANRVYNEGKCFYDLLNELYMKYGFHYCYNSYFICENSNPVKSMFNKLRNFDGDSGNYPKKLECEKETFKVLRVRDVTTGYDSEWDDKKCTLPTPPNTEMITFFFKDIEMTIEFRDNEQKLKYYSEIFKKAPEEDWQDLRMLLINVVKTAIEHWIRPEDNGFEYPQVTD